MGSRHRPLLDRQLLFTVYNHPHPEFPGFPPGSLFHGREVANRVAVRAGNTVKLRVSRARDWTGAAYGQTGVRPVSIPLVCG